MTELAKGKFFKWLLVFHVVAEEGSISGAAKRLKVSQPAVSYLVRNLENELGVELFSRRNSAITLTRDGKTLYARSAALIGLFNEIKAEMSALDKSAYRGDIVLTTTQSFAGSHLPLYVDVFKKSNPNVRFTIISGMSSQAILDSVVKAEVDFGIVSMERIPDNIQADFLFRAHLVLIAPCGWNFSINEQGCLTDLSELENVPFLTRLHSDNVKRYINRYLVANGIRPNTFISINNYHDIRAFVGAGVGCAIVEDFEKDQKGRYNVHALPYDSAASNYYIIRGRRKYMPPQSAAFIRSMLRKKSYILP